MNSLLDSNILGTFVLVIVVYAVAHRGYTWSNKAKKGYGLRNFGLTENALFVEPSKATKQQKEKLRFYSKGMTLLAFIFLLLLTIFFIANVSRISL